MPGARVTIVVDQLIVLSGYNFQKAGKHRPTVVRDTHTAIRHAGVAKCLAAAPCPSGCVAIVIHQLPAVHRRHKLVAIGAVKSERDITSNGAAKSATGPTQAPLDAL